MQGPQGAFRPPAKEAVQTPSIGSIEVLNGCGISGAAGAAADYLRSKGFDVKDIGNASSWNYPVTIVASRTVDTDIAEKVSRMLNTDKMIIMRNGDTRYDATVFLGADFAERIQ